MAQNTYPSTPLEARASPGLTNNNTAAGVKRKRATEKKYYAVKVGKKPGVYATWEECLGQVRGQKGALFKAFPSSHDAQAFVDGKLIPTPSDRQSTEPKYYGVQNGKTPGVYTDWTSAQGQIRGVKNPKYKKFSTRAEAEAFVFAGRRNSGLDLRDSFTTAEESKRQMIRKSAPGLVTNGTYAPTDRDGNAYELGRAPLPPGAEDGFDPNIRLAADGSIVNKTEEEKAKTKLVPKESNPPDMLRIYTDGSSLKNGQAGARAGVGVYFGPADPKNVSEALKGSRQTNQRAELTAILRALDIAPRHHQVTIYTDSKYAIDCVTNWYRSWEKNGWLNSKGKAVENKDLVVEIREKIGERDLLQRGTYFVWVKGHANDVGNFAADRLAVEGATKAQSNINGGGKKEKPDSTKINGVVANGDSSDAGEEDEVGDAFKAMEEALADGSGDD